MSIIDAHLDGTPWFLTMAQVEERIAGRTRHAKMEELPPVRDGYKRCGSYCKKILPATDEYFSRRKQAKDGLDYRCKKCKYKYDRERVASFKIS